MNKIAPMEKIILKHECPWFDLELTRAKAISDYLYCLFDKTYIGMIARLLEQIFKILIEKKRRFF